MADQAAEAEELIAALAAQQAPPDTPEAALAVVLEALRQNLLFERVRAQLTLAQDWLLRAATLYRVPVTEDGLRAIAESRATLAEDRERLLGYALLEPSQGPLLKVDRYQVPPVVHELLGGADGFTPDQLRALNAAMGRYHRFQGAQVTRTWSDDLEAIHHFRAAGDHLAADALAEPVSGAYYARGAFVEARIVVEPVVERVEPPPPWWALNRLGMCLLAIGDSTGARPLFERALKVVANERDRGATLNNISALCHARGEYGPALKVLEESLAILREIGDRAGLIPALHNLAHLALDSGDLDLAFERWREALGLARETGDALGLFHVAGAMGQVLAQLGQPAPARQLLALAIQVGRQSGLPGVEALEQTLAGLGPDEGNGSGEDASGA